jgi:uncharacterized protein (TIGR04222 family)
MSDLWGISGPSFLELYLGLLIVPAVAGVIWWQWYVRQTKPNGTQPELTLYHLAYLAAGRTRVAETAIASLIEGERLRVDSKGYLHRIGKQDPADPVERAVFGQSRIVPATSMPNLIDEAVAELAEDLAARGLVLRAKPLETCKRTVVGLYVAIGVFGLVRLIAGASAHHPVGLLLVLLVADLVAIGVSTAIARRGSGDLVTEAGRELVRAARAHRKAGRKKPGPEGLVLAGAAGAVVLQGVRAYPDREVVKGLTYHPPIRRRCAGPGSGRVAGTRTWRPVRGARAAATTVRAAAVPVPAAAARTAAAAAARVVVGRRVVAEADAGDEPRTPRTVQPPCRR